MSQIRLNRRRFLECTGIAASLALTAACAPAAPAPTPTEAPAEVAEATPTPTTAPAEVPAAKYNEAPMLAERVQAGTLPPVEERLPKEPMVIPVTEEIGQYGGTWHRCAVGPGDASIIFSRLGYENLVRWNEDLVSVSPNLVKSFEISEDATEFTFYLREGTRWSDGEPLTADDFVFWYEDILLNKEITPTIPKHFRDPVNDEVMVLEKVDDYTFKIRFGSPYGLYIQVMAGADGLQDRICAPKHYLTQFHPKYVAKDELDKKTKDAKFENWWEYFANRRLWDNPEHPRLTPWIPTRVPPDIPILCERNPYYWKTDPEGNQLPYIDRVQFDVVENSDLLNLKAVAGELDMQFRHIMWSNYPLFIENAEKGDYRVMKWTLAEGSNCLLFPNMNHKDPGLRELLANLDFRIALSHGINRSDINELAYQGFGTPRQASLIPQSAYFKEEHALRYADHDPEKANGILDDLGLTERDSEGFRLRLDGQPLLLTVEYFPQFGPWRDVLQMMSEQWQEIGIRMTPKEEDRTLVAERAGAGETDVSVGTMDYCATPLIRPDRFVPFGAPGVYESNAVQWWTWNLTRGQQGEEPPEEVKQQYALYDQIRGASPDALPPLAEQFFDNASINLWNIGTVGVLPHVGVVKNNFRNVPEEAVSDWLLLTPGNTNVEQYFIRQG
ncbi:MAG: ABC transporter substrate-binding protein [Anaerolineae bacterium]|nr:ABC transporter substrate-binding protein [Anaerolineae bacterium]